MKYEFIWYNPKLSPNRQPKNPFALGRLRKKQKEDTAWQLVGKPIPSKRDKYELWIEFNPPGNYGYDSDNSLAAIKGLLDVLAAAWGVSYCS